MSAVVAQALAQLSSLVAFALLATWYVVPWLRERGRADALIPLLWVDVFRYVTLQTASAQQAGFPISDGGRDQIMYSGLLGMGLALAAIIALRYRLRLAVPLAWLFVIETVADIAHNAAAGTRERLFGQASGVTWLILSFYVPLVVASVSLLTWQLWTRRGEALASRDIERP